MAQLTKVDTIAGNDTLVISREQDAGFRGALVSALVTYLNATVSGEDGKSLLNGATAPGVMDGTEGDFWIDTSTYDIYGPKAGMDWGTPTSLIGPTGPQGDGVPIGGLANQVLTPAGWVSALAGIDSIDFDTSAGVTPQEGRLSWNATDGTLNLGLKGGLVTLQVGQENVQLVKHADNTGLTEGKVVYVTGSDGANMTVRYAQANAELTSSKTIGVMTENATGGNKAYMTTFGLVRNIDTSTLTEGAIVYISSSVAGGMTTSQPIAPDHSVSIGFCIRSHASVGSIFVNVNNGFELDELHDVLITTPANNDILTYESATSLWKNKPNTGAVSSVNGYTGAVVLGKNDIGLGNVQNLDTSVASNITQDATHRFATDAEKATWNGKQAALGFTPVPDTRTVNGVALSGDVTLTKVSIGLGNVDNTSDADKPVSTLQAGAIALKEDDLGTPAANGYILVSNMAKVRSWVPMGGGIPEAPIDGTTYGRKDAGWIAVGAGSQEVYVQDTDPGLTGPGIWIQTGLAPGGTGFTWWFEDGL